MSRFGKAIFDGLRTAIRSPGATARKVAVGGADAMLGISDTARGLKTLTTGGSPYRALAGLSAGALGYTQAVRPVVDFFRDAGAEEKAEGIDAVQQVGARSRALGRMLEMERLKRNAEMNKMLLMQLNPELANQLQAGRRLPRQGLVIGGRKRQRTMLDVVAAQLSQGQYNEPVPLSEQVLLSLGDDGSV